MHAKDILRIGFMFFILFIKKIKGEATTKDITYPNVGVTPLKNPAYIGRNNPNPKYNDVIIKESQTVSTVKQMIKTINN